MVLNKGFNKTEFRRNYIPWILAGVAACAVTHLATAPLDMYKVLANAGPTPEYKNVPLTSLAEFLTYCVKNDFSLMFRGWQLVLAGYGQQGIFKFGLYTPTKLFVLSKMKNPGILKRLAVFMAITPFIEALADIALSVCEYAKVEMQKDPSVTALAALTQVMNEPFSVKLGNYLVIIKRQIVLTTIKFPAYEMLLLCLGALATRFLRARADNNYVIFASGFLAGALGAVPAHIWDRGIGMDSTNTSFVTGLGSSVLRMGAISASQWLIFNNVHRALTARHRDIF